ncbi:MAG: DUF4870 domain-containing protein [Propionibacteriaceae bacterium]|nr:DUF4870 domain-containing protein [Propionibacteriaceae bacterium]
MTNDAYGSSNTPDEPMDGVESETTDSGYQPSYTEPTYDTASEDIDWNPPTEAGSTGEDAGVHASPPDTTPLTEEPADTASGPGEGEPAAPWWGGSQVSGGATAAAGQQPMQGQPQNPQQAPWGGPQQGQPYQQAPPPGGMPPQNYGGGYSPMTMGYNNPNYLAGPSEQGRSTLTLDYWLSVFFSWIPALIFFLTEKDKNKLVDEHTKELLNFNITRIIASAVMVIPVIGWIIGGIASLALFIVAILGALKGPEEYLQGRTYQFPLAIRFIK